MKAEYRSAIRSRKLIRAALLELMQTRDLPKITVTDIVAKADINRATFYAHYPDVRGVTEEIEEEIIAEMLEVLSKFEYDSFFRNPTPLLLKVSRFLEEKQTFYKMLILSHGADQFLEKLEKIFLNYIRTDAAIPEPIRESKAFALRTCYFSGGIVNMYKQWFKEELHCSLNDISIEIGKMILLSAKDMLP
ncbi:MAG: TetR-like C-terminal domain-containing protein [Candidatus Limiplasma sp.]|nr:TetR-like C-terminal domain-containing protein [Candidatus Limiplasma sp.]